MNNFGVIVRKKTGNTQRQAYCYDCLKVMAKNRRELKSIKDGKNLRIRKVNKIDYPEGVDKLAYYHNKWYQENKSKAYKHERRYRAKKNLPAQQIKSFMFFYKISLLQQY